MSKGANISSRTMGSGGQSTSADSARVSRVRRTFTKRTFTLPLLLRSFGALVLYAPVRWLALLKPATSRSLREKVIIGVTSVNDCRWCSWLHTGIALKQGVDLAELQSLLGSGNLGTVSEPEATAVLFAQHFADTRRHPTPAARLALARQFTPGQRLEIMAWIHFIYFANLCGNSADAWLARFRGWKIADGHPLPEGVAGLAAAPVLLIGWFWSRKWRPAALAGLWSEHREAPDCARVPKFKHQQTKNPIKEQNLP